MNDPTFDDPAQGQGDTMTMSMTASDLAQVQIIHRRAKIRGAHVRAAYRPVRTSLPNR